MQSAYFSYLRDSASRPAAIARSSRNRERERERTASRAFLVQPRKSQENFCRIRTNPGGKHRRRGLRKLARGRDSKSRRDPLSRLAERDESLSELFARSRPPPHDSRTASHPSHPPLAFYRSPTRISAPLRPSSIVPRNRTPPPLGSSTLRSFSALPGSRSVLALAIRAAIRRNKKPAGVRKYSGRK